MNLTKAVLDAIRPYHGVLPGILEHRCPDCTHKKRNGVEVHNEITLDAVVGVDELPEVCDGF